MADTTSQFKALMSDLFRMEEDLEIVAKWEIGFAEMARIVSEGFPP